MSPASPRWIGLAGPTASGKSHFALELARLVPLEIVSVDSALVYRGMDIGTAKPSAAERATVPHHLLDLRDPTEPYSAAQFVADAQRAITEIAARGRLPLLVGGTMLYFKALIDGLDALPASDPAVRAAIEAAAAAQGWPSLHAELARVDPAAAARLAPHDAQRIARALEVWRLSGRPLSSLHSAPRRRRPPLLVSLEPAERGWLHARIAARFDAMLDAGLLDELRRLRTQPGVHAGLPALRAVGYRQAWEALDAGLEGDALRRQVRERGVAATRQLAKRQLTWLRSMPERRTVACDAPDAFAQVLRHVKDLA
ncbi:MAG TPA: tRNA (adenosine(37)-N6)-dimethylallyltransferase MiaA [Burkholderiaceae bacterium]|nr:tRNA (adenosine(37)-N6)-dimethylallyltransferase MiaA [Burkholderiaceae bacterium]